MGEEAGFLECGHYLCLLLRSGHHNTQAVALKHPTWEYYTEHCQNKFFVSVQTYSKSFLFVGPVCIINGDMETSHKSFLCQYSFRH